METLSLVGASTSLLTDRYELTMLSAALRDGTAARASTFELFARRLPRGRRYGVVAGLGRAVEAVRNFTFTAEQCDYLRRNNIVDEATVTWLENFRFSGDITAYAEGELYFPGSPVVTVDAPFGEAVLLETVLLSIFNHDSAVASAGARMVSVAQGRTLVEMGSRRTSERAAVAAARAAYIVGFDLTSNLEAGFAYGVPTTGTSAHAFTLAHTSERAAFVSQVAALGSSTTLLVDTYDVEQGIRTAVEVAGTQLGGVRLDSGVMSEEAARARTLLDLLGAFTTRVVCTGDLDEYALADLADSPVDSYGVGTRLVTGSGAPTAEMVYKLVAIADDKAQMRPVAKKSSGKASVGGRKQAVRQLNSEATAVAELVSTQTITASGRDLQIPVFRGGELVHTPDIEAVRAHHRQVMTELTLEDLSLVPGTPRLAATTQAHV